MLSHSQLYLFIVFYSFSIGPLAWIYIAESKTLPLLYGRPVADLGAPSSLPRPPPPMGHLFFHRSDVVGELFCFKDHAYCYPTHRLPLVDRESPRILKPSPSSEAGEVVEGRTLISLTQTDLGSL